MAKGKNKDQSGKSKEPRVGASENNNEANKFGKGTVSDSRPIKPKKK